MKKICFALIAISTLFNATGQTSSLNWQPVPALPADHIYSVRTINGKLFAGATDKVYFSTDGNHWDSSEVLSPTPAAINDICSFNGKLYAAAIGTGVLESIDNGHHWTLFNGGIPSLSPVEFATRNGVLYTGTNDQGVYKLTAAANQWIAHNNGLMSGTSYVFETLANTSHCLLGGVAANGVLTAFYDTGTAWTYRYLTGGVAAGLTTYDLLQAGSNIWAFTNNKAYASSDSGRTWVGAGAGMRNSIHEGSKAVIAGDRIFAAINFGGNHSAFYKRGITEPLSNTWISIDTLYNIYCYSPGYFNNKFYIATSRGLLYTDISPVTQAPELIKTQQKIIAYPNPASQTLRLVTEKHTSVAAYTLADTYGRTWLRGNISSKFTDLDVSLLPPGLYLLSVDNGTERHVLKTVIQR